MKNDFEGLLGFQWDRGNIDKNLIKHNVENWECEQIFFNRPLVVMQDSGHSAEEERWAALGKTDASRFLVVIFTKRERLVRVISARDLNRKERKFYEEAEKEYAEIQK